jgi:acylpyruvate hydrolase
MQIVTFTNKTENSRIGLINEDKIADLRMAFELMAAQDMSNADTAKELARECIPNSMIELVKRGDDGIQSIKQVAEFLDNNIGELAQNSIASRKWDNIIYDSREVEILKPIEVFRALNIGANYNAYLSMMNIIEPFKGTAETFWKFPQTVIGPEEKILWPISSKQISCEMELGVIIGKKIKRVPKKDALECVFGYTVVNDTTAIDLLKRGLGTGREGLPGFYYLCLAKSFDTFESIGPCITLKESISDPQDLNAEFRVNGELKVKGNTSDMRLDVAEMIEYISQDITLYPGDLIATGAMASEDYAPQVNVSIGDVVEMSIDNIGTLKNYISK